MLQTTPPKTTCFSPMLVFLSLHLSVGISTFGLMAWCWTSHTPQCLKELETYLAWELSFSRRSFFLVDFERRNLHGVHHLFLTALWRPNFPIFLNNFQEQLAPHPAMIGGFLENDALGEVEWFLPSLQRVLFSPYSQQNPKMICNLFGSSSASKSQSMPQFCPWDLRFCVLMTCPSLLGADQDRKIHL